MLLAIDTGSTDAVKQMLLPGKSLTVFSQTWKTGWPLQKNFDNFDQHSTCRCKKLTPLPEKEPGEKIFGKVMAFLKEDLR